MGYSIKRIRVQIHVNLNSVKKLHSINESESGFGFGEYCLNPIHWRHNVVDEC